MLVTQLCPTLCNPRTVACQGPLSRGFSRQEHWNGLPFPSPGDLRDIGFEPAFPASPALAGGFFTSSVTCEKFAIKHGKEKLTNN